MKYQAHFTYNINKNFMASSNGFITALCNYASEYFYPTQSNNKMRWSEKGDFAALHPHFTHVHAIIAYAKTLNFDKKTQKAIPHLIEIIEKSMHNMKHIVVNHNDNIKLKDHTHSSTDFLNTRVFDNEINIQKIKFNLKKLTNYIDKKVGSMPSLDLDQKKLLNNDENIINNENLNEIELNSYYSINNSTNQIKDKSLTPYEKHRQDAKDELEKLTQENNKNQIIIENKLKWLYRIFVFKKISTYVLVVSFFPVFYLIHELPWGTGESVQTVFSHGGVRRLNQNPAPTNSSKPEIQYVFVPMHNFQQPIEAAA